MSEQELREKLAKIAEALQQRKREVRAKRYETYDNQRHAYWRGFEDALDAALVLVLESDKGATE